ncbi:MAG: nucleoside-diphosphate sugar epimerase/dehydratase [Pseudomonadota bacterium]
MSTQRDERRLAVYLRLKLLRLERTQKQTVAAVNDWVVAFAATMVACWATDSTAAGLDALLIVAVITATLVVPINSFFSLYRSVVRFLGIDLIAAGTRAMLVVAAVFFVLAATTGAVSQPVRTTVVFAAMLLIGICGTRFFARIFLNRRMGRDRERVVIYGSGAAGVRLASALSAGDHYLPVAFADDNPQLWGKVVGGLEVFPASEIGPLVERRTISQVLLALPSISRRRKRKILESLGQLPVHVQTVPEMADIVAGRARVDDIRDVEVEDLLGRDAIAPNPELLNACIEGKAVMVTGAGGSIGSELCRQILSLGPRRLVMYELSEASLYQINRQLERLNSEADGRVELVPLLGNVHHRDRVQLAMQQFGVQTVYHAAAYKHVPIVEENLVEGVHNNVFGTLHTAQAAIGCGVETFVLVSTDKAVSPTNVMGATKRFAELVLQALHRRESSTRFCMVRFGNVLASSGSVVPLFRDQIRAGGPVTVTHPEIIRYFMTIPEAAQLVIQAGSMAEGGDVFVLDMGKPVKILDLARRMVHLMGLSVQDDTNPDGDIEIQFTGLRPAEKLYEELLIGTDVTGTEHPRILRANEECLAPEELNPLIDELWDASLALDPEEARRILLRAVSGYKPTGPIVDLVWKDRTSNVASDAASKVADLAAYRDLSHPERNQP